MRGRWLPIFFFAGTWSCGSSVVSGHAAGGAGGSSDEGGFGGVGAGCTISVDACAASSPIPVSGSAPAGLQLDVAASRDGVFVGFGEGPTTRLVLVDFEGNLVGTDERGETASVHRLAFNSASGVGLHLGDGTAHWFDAGGAFFGDLVIVDSEGAAASAIPIQDRFLVAVSDPLSGASSVGWASASPGAIELGPLDLPPQFPFAAFPTIAEPSSEAGWITSLQSGGMPGNVVAVDDDAQAQVASLALPSVPMTVAHASAVMRSPQGPIVLAASLPELMSPEWHLHLLRETSATTIVDGTPFDGLHGVALRDDTNVIAHVDVGEAITVAALGRGDALETFDSIGAANVVSVRLASTSRGFTVAWSQLLDADPAAGASIWVQNYDCCVSE